MEIGIEKMMSLIINNKKTLPIKISGESMYPKFKNGDIVYIKALSCYDINDVVVINHKNHFIIHRIIKIMNMGDDKYYLTKGDNNTFIDRWFPSICIIGKVISKEE